MRVKLIEHFLSIGVVSLILIAALFISKAGTVKKESPAYARFSDISFVDCNNPFHTALLHDVYNIFYPGRYDENKRIVNELIREKEKQFRLSLMTSHVKEGLTGRKFIQLGGMLLKFVLVYAVVMFLTYYGVQTFGVWRFIRRKRQVALRLENRPAGFAVSCITLVKKIAQTGVYMLLFSPAYVIAYSIRTEFNTDTVFFVVLLGVVSNGLLVMYTNKFYTFLMTESRKGYVETAVVKNCKNSYSPHDRDGIPYREIFRIVKRFDGHVFGHIFKNAQYQYISTIKEQASFLITGLIIIEMALNIHGYLNYEMLRQILYANYDIVIAIILGIFYTVKVTEIVTDILYHRVSLKYENR